MKNFLRSVSLVLVLVTVCLSLASCGKSISGSYTAEAELFGLKGETTYTFGAFGKVTRTHKATVAGKVTTTEAEGKYKIEKDGDKMEITLTFEDDKGEKVENTYTFEKGEDSIKIGLVEYKKV